MKNKNATAGLLVLLLGLSSVGCQGVRSGGSASVGGGVIAEKLDIPSGVPWKQEKKPSPGVPVRVVATWKDAVLQRAGQPSQRGLGGRLYFYDGKNPTPIPVEGQLVVYAFDEAGRKPTDNRPTRRYVFPVEQFVKHQSDSELGVSYSFWLPWDEAGGAATEISLIARFEPIRGGSLVVSEQTSTRLPGSFGLEPSPETKIARVSHGVAVRQASHSADAELEQTIPNAAPANRRMETTTIALPGRRRVLPVAQTSPHTPSLGGWQTEVTLGAAAAGPR